MPDFALALHGGAGTIARHLLSASAERDYRQALHDALQAGAALLRQGASALDAVEATVVVLENCPLFNAGRGAVFTHEGHHEMDASLMDGRTGRAGAITGVRSLQNPIQAARLVMERSEHVLLAWPGVEEFAREHGLPTQPAEYFFTEHRYAQLQEALQSGQVRLDHSQDAPVPPLEEPVPFDEDPKKKMGTVGAVARDVHGHLAAATSTGGMTNKRYSRIGDSPIIGAGTWADDRTCAISCTGHGEYFMRAVVAHDIACLMEYRGLSLQEACRVVVHEKLAPVGGEGGLVAVDAAGNIALPFNSEGMYRASISSSSPLFVGIYKEE
ncbi:isoaspartyl peptidase/L-asparaginase [Hymenobacter busanensis]|uniref:Isoaspartyl peptidase n=1 Tax=Hymenobacter busanensis TaxID=2607656 RepID=A0A7L4ZSB9_9BACT|nr:isoaspartyl peptidase/L-asparaginase [Hymenobacter busanensis]KAA9327458.1 isoaspartyl peptidase/L-asparaginase [Hymenobacter busanensis]QHJ06204.1 beta-aspartyl-peptidase [Hymenobacter busanensis]